MEVLFTEKFANLLWYLKRARRKKRNTRLPIVSSAFSYWNLKATDPGIKQALKDGFPGVLSNLDRYGRKILVLFAANWDQSR